MVAGTDVDAAVDGGRAPEGGCMARRVNADDRDESVAPGEGPTRGGVRATVARLDAAYRFDGPHRRVMLVRHAKPVPVAGGPYDPALGEEGRRQARLLADRLVGLVETGDTAVVVSPRRRAAETGEVVAERLGVAPIVEDGVAEVGGLGAPVPVVLTEGPDVVPRFRWAEPDGPFRPHAFAGVHRALAATSASTVVVVSHGGFINAFVSQILELDGEFFFYPRHTSLTVVRVRERAIVLDRLNDAAHLEGSPQ